MDTGQLLQQLFQVLQATQPHNDATRALQRTQSGLQIGNQLGLLPTDQPILQALSQSVPGLIRAAFLSPSAQAPGLPDAWKALSTQYNIPLTDFTALHQGGMDPGVFSNIMTTNPDLGTQLLSFSNAAGGLLGTGNLAQVYGAAQSAAPAALMALPADAAALGTASALPGLTGAAGGAAAAEAGAAATGTAGILAALGLSAL